MRKKHIILVSVILLSVIVIGFVLVKYVFNFDIKANLQKEKVMPTWSIEKYGEDSRKEEESLVNTNAKKIDRDPESITVLVNKENEIDKDYKPTDLVEPDIKFSFNYKDEKRKMRKEAALNLELLFQGAEYYGYTLEGVSGFRSYERQKTIYEYNLINNGLEYTQVYSAMPGTSEHQTGLAIDVTCPSLHGRLSDKFGEMKEGKWLANNCYKYGYIIRYPKNKSDITGYGYEPWHIRYVGYDLAKYLHDKDITLDEYYKYKLDMNMVNRSVYAYYDYLLTMKKGGYTDLSDAVLDDVVDADNVDMSNSEPLEQGEEEQENKVTNPNDIFDKFNTQKPEVTAIPETSKTPVTDRPTAPVVTAPPVMPSIVPTTAPVTVPDGSGS